MPTAKSRIHVTLDDPFIKELINKLVKAKNSTKSRQVNDKKSYPNKTFY